MYRNYLKYIDSSLSNLVVTGQGGAVLEPGDGFERWCFLTKEVKENNCNLFIIGNGASATMASHMALDATKNGRLKVMAFNDIASLTALGNDLGYEEVFSFPIKQYASSGDMLITISSSGNSPNIIRAVEVAREQDVKVVTLSGMKPDNRSRSLGDLNFYIPAATYGVVECAHQVLMHFWLDLYITRYVKNSTSHFCLPEM